MQAMGSKALAERKRVEAVVETLAAIHNHGENLLELAHDARNMVTALSLYCDLLEEPGVLTAAHRHYGSELRLVAEASRRLVENLALFYDPKEPGSPPTPESPLHSHPLPRTQRSERPGSNGRGSTSQDAMAANRMIGNLQEEVLACRNILAALAGPSIPVTVEAIGGEQPVQMRSEELIRVLVNLVRNAAEAIGGTATIHLSLTDREASVVVLAVEDTGTGIAEEFLEKVFDPGFTTRATGPSGTALAPGGRRGLGLAITRSIVEAAGGTIQAGNRAGGGARFVIELPVRAS